MDTNTYLVKDFLVRHAPQEFNAPTIAKALSINPTTTNTILSRLFNRSEIEKPQRGFYKAFVERDIPEISFDDAPSFHPIYLKAHLLEREGRATFLTQSITDEEGADPEKLVYWILEGNKRVFEYAWKGRRVRIEVSSKTIEIMVKATEKPLSIPDLEGFINFLEGLFFPDFWEYDWEMPNWGVNVDRSDWFIEGASSVTLRSCTDFIARWYNKKGLGVRREVHSAVPIALQDVVGYLKGGPIPQAHEILERLERTDTAIGALHKDYKRQQTLLSKLILVIHQLDPSGLVIAYQGVKEK